MTAVQGMGCGAAIAAAAADSISGVIPVEDEGKVSMPNTCA